ncbi:MAG: sigma-70 family RNA polymerase sigma factor [Planctomycetota bacterium]|nr:sigma-70 family RNA polymerase sigma factor [Planctomycetota bacterium]
MNIANVSQNTQYDRFVSLLVRHEQAVRGFVRSLMPSAHDVDDVMQEVGLACWRKFDSFASTDSPDDFVRWACVVARFEVLRHRRNYARDRIVLSEDIIELLATDAQSRLQTAAAERDAVELCLARLQESERRLLLSVHTPGDSIARIASELGQNARRLYSKVNSLRDLLGECVRRRLAEGEV